MKKRVLLIVLAMVLVAALSVGLTLAYFISHDEVVNTFTVGKVNITLDETDVDEYGVKDGDTRVKANSYKLIPGHTYVKDPTVTVAAKSEDCYVRTMVSFTYDKDADAFFKGLNSKPETSILTWFTVNSDWTVSKDAYSFIEKDGKYIATYEVRYNTKVVYSESATELSAVFTEIKVPATITGEQLENLAGLKIDVEAHAIQAMGFDNADDAWAKFTK